MDYRPSWLRQGNAIQRANTKLTLREAAVFLYESHSAVAKDCECLGIEVYPNKGGCLSQSDMWDLFVFRAWKAWKRDHVDNWRGDRKCYWSDWNTEAQLMALVFDYGATPENFQKEMARYLVYLKKHPSIFIQGDMRYAA